MKRLFFLGSLIFVVISIQSCALRRDDALKKSKEQVPRQSLPLHCDDSFLSAHTVDESDEEEDSVSLVENVQKLQQKMGEVEEILNQLQQKLINLNIRISSAQTKIAEIEVDIDNQKKQLEKISLLREKGQVTVWADLIRRQADIADAFLRERGQATVWVDLIRRQADAVDAAVSEKGQTTEWADLMRQEADMADAANNELLQGMQDNLSKLQNALPSLNHPYAPLMILLMGKQNNVY